MKPSLGVSGAGRFSYSLLAILVVTVLVASFTQCAASADSWATASSHTYSVDLAENSGTGISRPPGHRSLATPSMEVAPSTAPRRNSVSPSPQPTRSPRPTMVARHGLTGSLKQLLQFRVPTALTVSSSGRTQAGAFPPVPMRRGCAVPRHFGAPTVGWCGKSALCRQVLVHWGELRVQRICSVWRWVLRRPEAARLPLNPSIAVRRGPHWRCLRDWSTD